MRLLIPRALLSVGVAERTRGMDKRIDRHIEMKPKFNSKEFKHCFLALPHIFVPELEGSRFLSLCNVIAPFREN